MTVYMNTQLSLSERNQRPECKNRTNPLFRYFTKLESLKEKKRKSWMKKKKYRILKKIVSNVTNIKGTLVQLSV